MYICAASNDIRQGSVYVESVEKKNVAAAAVTWSYV